MGKKSVEFSKSSRFIHCLEGHVVKISKDPRDIVPKDFPREKRNLCEVAKSRVNPDHWMWKGHVT
jgi:hypothetical protein